MEKLTNILGCMVLALLLSHSAQAQLSKALLQALPDSIHPVPAGKIKLNTDEEKNVINHAGFYPLNISLLAEVDSLAAILEKDTIGLDDFKKFNIAQTLSTFYSARGQQNGVIRQSDNIAQLLKDKKDYGHIRIKYLAFKAIALNRLAKYEESILESYQMLEEAKEAGDSLGTGISFQALSFPEFSLDFPEKGLANLDSALSYYGKKAMADKDFSGIYYTLYASKYLGNFSLYEKTGKLVYIDSMRSVYQFSLANLMSPSPLQKSFPVIEAYAAKSYGASIAAGDSILADLGTQKDYTTTNLYKLVIVKKYKALSLYMLGKLPEAVNEMKSCINYCQDLDRRDTTRNFVKTTIIKLSQLVYDYAKQQHKWEEAFYYLDMNKKMQERLNVIENRAKVFETTQRYDFIKKESEIKVLESNSLLRKRERDIAVTITIASLLCLIVIALLLITRYKRLKLKKQLVEQEAVNQVERLNMASQIQIDELEEKARMAKAEEQKRLGQELHDELAGTLAAAKMKLESEMVKSNDSALHEKLKTISEQISAAYESTRNKSHEWYNKGNEKDDIAFSKRVKLIAENALPEADYTKEIVIDDEVIKKINTAIKINLLRIIQEALTNVLKYAKAHHVAILICEGEENAVLLEISDDGKGFHTDRTEKGIGLKSISSRVEELKGQLFINSSETGTKIKIIIPPIVSQEELPTSII